MGCKYKIMKLLGFSDEDHYGCVDLLNMVQKRLKPRYHVYGHIHAGKNIEVFEFEIISGPPKKLFLR